MTMCLILLLITLVHVSYTLWHLRKFNKVRLIPLANAYAFFLAANIWGVFAFYSKGPVKQTVHIPEVVIENPYVQVKRL